MIESSGRLDLDLINFVRMHLKDEKTFNVMPFNNLTINAIDEQKISIQDFTKNFFEIFKNLYIERSQLESLQNFRSSLGVESIDQFRTESRIVFNTAIQDNAQKTCAIALKKFNSGEPFGSVVASSYIEKNPPHFSEWDFVNLKCGFQYMSPAQQAEKAKIFKSRDRLLDKKKLNNTKKHISKINKAGDEWKLILQVTAFYFSEQFKSSIERSEEHLIENYPSIVEAFKNCELEKKIKASEEAYRALCLEQEPKKDTPKVKASTKTNQPNKGSNKSQSTVSARPEKIAVPQVKKALAVDAKTVERLKLNASLNIKAPSPYFLHSRLRRWDLQDPLSIKDFVDTVEGNLVRKYEALSLDELLQQQACHNLGGILPLLSNNKLIDKYSVKYATSSNTSASTIGRSFYTEMHYKGNKYPGTIQLGIGKDNVIYHAMFTPVDLEERSEIKDFFSSKKNIEGLDEKEEAKWEQVSACTFEILENDLLVMNVKKQAVKFIIHPLN